MSRLVSVCNTLACRLVLFGLAIGLIPLVVISFLGLRTGQRGIESHTSMHLDSVALLKQESLETWFDEQAAMATVLLGSRATGDPAVSGDSDFSASPYRWHSATLVDPANGNVIANSGREPAGPGGADAQLVSAASGQRTVAFDPRRDGSGSGLVTLAQPATTRTGLRAVLILQFDGSELMRLLRPDEGLPGGRIYLMAEDLAPLITVDRGGIVRPASVSVGRIEADEGLFLRFHDGDTEMIARTAALSGTPWRMAVAIPAGAAFADVTSGRIVVALGAVIATLLTAGLAAVLALGVAGPISRLAARVRSYRLGDPYQPMPLAGSAEILELTGAFNRMGDEIHRQGKALLEANRDLTAANEAKNRFLSVVTHELRTPLTAILAFSESLAQNRPGNLTERQLEHLKLISRSGRRLNSMIGDLLDISRIESGRLDLRPVYFDVAEMVDEIRRIFEPVVSDAGQKLVARAPARASVLADRDRLLQVILNLLSNASKYSPAGSTITLSVEASPERVSFTVADEGIGISEDDQAKLFTTFFRADNVATRQVPGTGLGLVIARNLVRLQGGDLSLTSRSGAGTEVRFFLPRGPMPELVEGAPRELAEAATGPIGELSLA